MTTGIINWVTLETPRLWLRPWHEETDFESYADLCADPEVMRYLGGVTMNRAEAWRHFAMLIGHWYLRGFGVWALEEKATGKLVGRSGFLHPVGWPDFELGWTLARAAWGKGYATEAAEAALKHAFTVMQRPYVISLIRPDNVRSQQVATRIGETLAGECQLLGSVAQIHRIDYDTWQQRQQPLNL